MEQHTLPPLPYNSPAISFSSSLHLPDELEQKPVQAERSPALRCRLIDVRDFHRVAVLLGVGFRKHSVSRFLNALSVLKSRQVPAGFPQFGFVLESDGDIVGVLLTIVSQSDDGAASRIRCNVSCWYVVEAFRSFAPFLFSRLAKLPKSTIINISPHFDTLATIGSQGYQRYASGCAAGIAVFSGPYGRLKLEIAGQSTHWGQGLSQEECQILIDHQHYGCTSVVCLSDQRSYPFVFRRRWAKHVPLPFAQLMYCRDLSDLKNCAGPVARFLAVRGMPWLVISADGPIKWIYGKWFENRNPAYFRGPDKPRLGDLSYTEAALFGF